MGGELSTYVEKINAYRILVGKPEERGVDGRKMLFRLKKYAVDRTLLHPFTNKRQTVTIFRVSQNR